MNNTFNPKICVAVPVFNRLELTLRFLNAFTKSTYNNYVIVITDDGTKDTASEINKLYPQVITFKEPVNSMWWAGGTNSGVKYALNNNFDYVLTINQDAVVSADYLQNLVNTASSHPKDITCSLIMFENEQNKIWAAGASLNWSKPGIFELNYYKQQLTTDIESKIASEPVTISPGDGVLVPLEVYKNVGLYNQEWFPKYHADSDFCLRAGRAGYKIWVSTKAQLENDIPSAPELKNPLDLIFSKKSGNYWRPTVMMYLKYAPWYFKWGFIYAYAALGLRFTLRKLGLLGK